MDLTPSSAFASASTTRSSARIGGWRGAITRASIPGDRVAEERFRQVQRAYRVLGDREPAPSRTTAAACPRRAARSRRRACRSPASTSRRPPRGRARRRSRSCSPTSFRTRRAARRRAARGARPGRDARPAVRGRDARRRVPAVGRAPGALRGVPRRGPDVRRRRQPVRNAAAQASRRWARGHMVFTKDCEACEGRGALSARGLPERAAAPGMQPRSEVVTVRRPAGRRVSARGSSCPAAGTRRAAARRRRSRRHARGRAASVLPARRPRPAADAAAGRARGRARRARRGADARRAGRGCGFRRARRRASVCGCRGRGVPAADRRSGRGRRPARRGRRSCCRRCSTSDRRRCSGSSAG